MRLSQQTVQKAFDNLAQMGIDNKVWGVLVILKNIQKLVKLPTSMGVMTLAICNKTNVQRDLKNFFSLLAREDEDNSLMNEVDWILLRRDFSYWVANDLLGNKKIDYLSLAVFLYRNRVFQREYSKGEIIQDVKKLLNIRDEWAKEWFKEVGLLDIQFDNSVENVWPKEFVVNNRTYKFDKTHNSIIFKPSKDFYSVVAKPDELSRGPFYQPLYAAQGNALLFMKDSFFEENEPIQSENKSVDSAFSKSNSPFTPAQIIYYGVPGCGKSHTINEKLKNVADYNKIRTVFHPEYTNADFIGQILPEVNVDANGRSIVEYKFNPGPFTEIVRRAYQNPDEEFFLVIEEINRGNAAAIFGDMFQLLDRLDADEKPEEVSSEHIYGAGWSSYGVDNPDVNAYIRNQLVIVSEKTEHCSKVNGFGEDANPRLYKSVDIESDNLKVTWKEKNGNAFVPKPKHLHFSANTAIRLPPNLSIYATMNTSDQNVFTLDNAFQRRWDMELVPNTCKWDDADHKKQAQLPIGDTDICWETFRKAINSVISDGDFFNADDKQLGLFFIEADGEKIDEKKFANKVLKYLWADVFKRDTGKIFKSENLSNVVQDFTGTDAFDKVFTDEFAQSQKDTNDAIKNR